MSTNEIKWPTTIQWVITSCGTQNFFPLAETEGTNQPDVLSSCMAQYSHCDVRLLFVRESDKKGGEMLKSPLLQEGRKLPGRNQCKRTWVPAVQALASQRKQSVLQSVLHLDSDFNPYWHVQYCNMCTARLLMVQRFSEEHITLNS